MRREPRIPLVVSLAVFALPASAAEKGIDATQSLETRMEVAQEIGNVFSRTIAFQINGYDPLVKRVSGTATYKVEQVTPQQIVAMSLFVYDGRPASSGETTIKDGGRTVCWKGDCSVSTDASGVSVNPLLWGTPHGTLHVGQSWEVTIAVPWEVGPPGKQGVKVVSMDPANDTITLERTGEGEGDSVNEFKTLPLVKEGKTYTVDVSLGKARWSGYTTVRRGVILNDVLFVERPVTVTSKEMGQSTGIERQYILLNMAPAELLRN